MSHQPRRIFTPAPPRKRKEREVYFPYKPPATIQPPNFTAPKAAAAAHPHGSNRLLAGYMAYEFLTKGTLFGQKYDPVKAAAVPVAGGLKRVKPEAEPNLKEHKSYAEVANIMRANEAHIPGIFNPAQLAQWMQM